MFSLLDLPLNGSKADPLSDESPISPASPPGPQSPKKCLSPPHQPSPPAAPPNPKNVSRLRRAPSLTRTRPSLSHSSGLWIEETNVMMTDHNPATSGHVINR